MSTASSAQDFGFDVWMRPFRDAMAAFQPGAFGSAGSMPGMGAWPAAGWMPGGATPTGFSGMGAWPGQMPGGFAPGLSAAGISGPFAAMFEQLSTQAQGQWQQFAGHFNANAGDDAMSQWRRALEGMAPAVTGAFDLSALRGMDQAAVRDALATPAIGPLREHVERWQKAMLAQLDYQDAAQAFSVQLNEIMKLALSYYERRLATRAAPGQPPASMRALFDEWIEAGEQAWAERASSDAFVTAMGRYTNAQLQVRAAQADQINRLAEHLGLPTRGEVDADHRRIAMLERELRRLRGELDQLRPPTTPAQAAPAVAEPKPRVVPIRPDMGMPGEATAAAVPAPAQTKPSSKISRGKTGQSKPDNIKSNNSRPSSKTEKKPKAKKSATRSSKPAKAAKPERLTTSATVLPIVAAPRAIGAAARKPVPEAAARRRAGK